MREGGEWRRGEVNGASGACEDGPGVIGGEKVSESSAGDRASIEDTLERRL